MKRLRKAQGFTLVELLVVVAIIAILVLIAIPRFGGSTNNATLKTFEGNVRTLASQVVQYQAENNGGVDGIEGADSSVKKWADDQEDKPNGATYDVAADKATCTLKEGGFDYTVEISYGTGEVKAVGTPTLPGELKPAY